MLFTLMLSALFIQNHADDNYAHKPTYSKHLILKKIKTHTQEKKTVAVVRI